MAKRDYDHLVKVVLIGETGVGKSCILTRYADDEFMESFISTIGVDYRFRMIETNGKHIKMQLWDTAGQDKFRSITSAYYRSADAIAVVYDITVRDTFDRVKTWIDEVHKYSENIQIIIIGNKSDRLDRQVQYEEGFALASACSALFIETSAKTGDGVCEVFDSIAEQHIRTLAIATAATAQQVKLTESTPLNGTNKKSFGTRFCPKWLGWAFLW